MNAYGFVRQHNKNNLTVKGVEYKTNPATF